ncbi:MAG: hypothetical protein IKQ14_07650 [Candidatus Methanomethylophilaceae archaeon]|nr:hypothetical protein [Candidatus Methanomethylophilaceae archaeon]MBR6214276.1 hypothetical protein [Candidatus Methanomethylophilaceae archaeon]
MPGETKKSKPVQKSAQKPAAQQKPAPQKAAAPKPAPKPAAPKPAAPKPANPKVIVAKTVPQKVVSQANSYSGEKSGAKKNKPVRTKESTKKQSMLNTHKLAPFKYDMNEILSVSRMDPAKASSFLASVIAKASRISTKTAKEFAKTYLDEGDLTKDEYDKICRLLDRYSKFR